MDISELTAYAEEKYNIKEERRWADLPGFSILIDPVSGRTAALLMRQWDPELGEEVQVCDIRCGAGAAGEFSSPCVTSPFRMRGNQWIGVRFGRDTDPGTVFALLDKALAPPEKKSILFTLDSLMPPAELSAGTVYKDTPLPAPGAAGGTVLEIPERIEELMKMYGKPEGSFAEKCRNFFAQARLMEDYEDSARWEGEFRRYFATYRDLRIDQLRGYFTWRSGVRRGEYAPVCASFVYIYIYELLNGIGAGPAEESLKKLKELEKCYVDKGLGDRNMKKNLRRWMFEFAVVKGLNSGIALSLDDPKAVSLDEALCVLKEPDEKGDKELYDALVFVGGENLPKSSVMKKRPEDGARLFAMIWREASKAFSTEKKDFFTLCFGPKGYMRWYPLDNAVYWEQNRKDRDYFLDPCRSYSVRDGLWAEHSVRPQSHDLSLFEGFLREADRKLRLYLKTGHPLKERASDSWASPLIDRVIAEYEREKAEAARPKVTISFSELDRIREDALATQGSLLTEEDKREAEELSAVDKGGTGCLDAGPGEVKPAGSGIGKSDGSQGPGYCPAVIGLSPELLEVLRLVLSGTSPKAFLRQNHMLAEIAADTINEALFDEVGDTVLICEGEELALIDDYREDIIRMLGGDADER